MQQVQPEGGVRPYLLIDVDFVLNPDFSSRWDGAEGDALRGAGWVLLTGFTMNDRPVWLNRYHGLKLLHAAEATGAKLAWATRWRDLANQVIAPVLGLPQLPVAPCPSGEKPGSVIPWTRGRPFVWLDDEDSVVEACSPVPGGHGVKVDPAAGLTDANLERAVALLGRAGLARQHSCRVSADAVRVRIARERGRDARLARNARLPDRQGILQRPVRSELAHRAVEVLDAQDDARRRESFCGLRGCILCAHLLTLPGSSRAGRLSQACG